MLQERGLEKFRQAFTGIQCDTAEVLRIYRYGNVIRHYRATATRSHDRNEDIARQHGIATQFLVFSGRDITPFNPTEFVAYGVVDPKHGYTLLNELRMKELATERAGSHAYGQ